MNNKLIEPKSKLPWKVIPDFYGTIVASEPNVDNSSLVTTEMLIEDSEYIVKVANLFPKLVGYIEQEINDINLNVGERAKLYLTDEEKENKDIQQLVEEFDLLNNDMDKYPVINYDSDDLENHNFDIGAYYQLNNILKMLQDGE